MTSFNIDQIKESLRNGICTVVFTKRDGSERKMRCTLLSSYIEEHNLTPVGGGPNYPVEQIRCIDVDKNEWRSFNIDTVLSFEQ